MQAQAMLAFKTMSSERVDLPVVPGCPWHRQVTQILTEASAQLLLKPHRKLRIVQVERELGPQNLVADALRTTLGITLEPKIEVVIPLVS